MYDVCMYVCYVLVSYYKMRLTQGSMNCGVGFVQLCVYVCILRRTQKLRIIIRQVGVLGVALQNGWLVIKIERSPSLDLSTVWVFYAARKGKAICCRGRRKGESAKLE